MSLPVVASLERVVVCAPVVVGESVPVVSLEGVDGWPVEKMVVDSGPAELL